MSELHKAYLNLGSNVEPQKNLAKAVELLKKYGQIAEVSTVWESQSVGSDGPNFLNACILFLTEFQPEYLKEKILKPIELEIGRMRVEDKNAPRCIDIDLIMFYDIPVNLRQWEYAFVVIPLAELIPNFIHPVGLQKLSLISKKMQKEIWIEPREDVSIF